MRPHGKARISARYPEALGLCDRCQFMYNLGDLQWQWDWQQGPRLKNLYKLVCMPCLDKPQESGRTIVLPPDPIPVANARPENYALADAPQSNVGFSPADYFSPQPPQTVSQNVGTLTAGNGLDAAFDGVVGSSGTAVKRYPFCALKVTSSSSFGNWVGKNWNQNVSGFTLINPSTVAIQTSVVSSVTFTSPSDTSFLFASTGSYSATSYTFDGSADGQTWTTINSGVTAASAGQVISFTPTSAAPYQYHRVAILGDGVRSVGIGQVRFTLSNAAPNDI